MKLSKTVLTASIVLVSNLYASHFSENEYLTDRKKIIEACTKTNPLIICNCAYTKTTDKMDINVVLKGEKWFKDNEALVKKMENGEIEISETYSKYIEVFSDYNYFFEYNVALCKKPLTFK